MVFLNSWTPASPIIEGFFSPLQGTLVSRRSLLHVFELKSPSPSKGAAHRLEKLLFVLSFGGIGLGGPIFFFPGAH